MSSFGIRAVYDDGSLKTIRKGLTCAAAHDLADQYNRELDRAADEDRGDAVDYWAIELDDSGDRRDENHRDHMCVSELISEITDALQSVSDKWTAKLLRCDDIKDVVVNVSQYFKTGTHNLTLGTLNQITLELSSKINDAIASGRIEKE